MPGRRQFLIACSYLAAAPAFVATLFNTGEAQAALPEAGGHAESAAAPNSIAPLMQIQGWESPGEAENASDEQMWIRMNSSWRGAWR
jgi:hypothetical protein